MSTWKTLLLLFVLVGVAVFFYPRRTPDFTHEGKRSTTINLWLTIWTSDAVRTCSQEFDRRHPGYTVQVGTATVRDVTADPSRFLLSVAGEDPPDVILFDRYAVAEWAARGAFDDLTPYIQADRNRADGVHQEDFFDPLWQESAWEGGQYAIPASVDIRGMYINNDLFIRAGLVNADGTITPPKSWQDICRKKFHGTGTVASGGLVTLHQPPTQDWGLSAQNSVRPGDVVTLRRVGGSGLFRARIREAVSATSFTVDFTRELPPKTTAIPAEFVSAPNLEIKIFDADSYTLKTTHFDDQGNMQVIGFAPVLGNSHLYFFAIQNGATLISPDGSQVLLDAPEVKDALQYMVDCYDAIGGFKLVKAFNDSQKDAVFDPFLSGKVAMEITGDWFLSAIAAFKPGMRFTLVAAPMPESELKRGVKPITWAGGWSYAIPSSARNKDAAWMLIRFLTTAGTVRQVYEVQAGDARAHGQYYVPTLPARKSLIPWLRQNYLSNPALSDSVISGYDTFTGLLPNARFRPHTAIGQKLWEAQITSTDECIQHDREIHDSLATGTRWLQDNLDRHLHPPTGPVINWWYLVGGYIVLLAAGTLVIARSEIRRRNAGLGRRDWKAGFVGISPWLVGFIVFSGGPILFSLIISFCRYDALSPAQFVGFANYTRLLGFHTDPLTHQFMANDPYFWQSLVNTAFMLIGLPLSIILGLILAMLLANQLRGIAVFRSLFYLPSIIPAVASFLLWLWIFDPSRGLLNTSLTAVGISRPPNWLAEAAWAKPAIILMGLWGVGGGMLIWLAGLKAIPVQLYEAAEIDGAGPWRKFCHVTFPMLSPYIFFNTVMGIIGTLQIFEASYIMTNGGPSNSTLFFVYYLFNQAFRYLDFGAASAMAWILFVVVLSLTLLQLKISRKWVHYD